VVVPGDGGFVFPGCCREVMTRLKGCWRKPLELSTVLLGVRGVSDGVTRALNTQPFPPAPVPGRGARMLLGLPKDVLKASHLCQRGEKYMFPSQLSRRIPENPNNSQEEASETHQPWRWGSREGGQPLLWGRWVCSLQHYQLKQGISVKEEITEKRKERRRRKTSVGWLQLGVQPRVERPMKMLASRSSPSLCPSLLHPRSTGDKS